MLGIYSYYPRLLSRLFRRSRPVPHLEERRGAGVTDGRIGIDGSDRRHRFDVSVYHGEIPHVGVQTDRTGRLGIGGHPGSIRAWRGEDAVHHTALLAGNLVAVIDSVIAHNDGGPATEGALDPFRIHPGVRAHRAALGEQ